MHRYNKLVNTDAQGRPAAARRPRLGRGLHARWRHLLKDFFTRRQQAFRVWWRAPVTTGDRVLGSIVGGLGAFWIAVLCIALLGAPAVPFTLWAGGSVAIGVVTGIVFPKAAVCVCFPFSTFGGS